jgi:hypothetical protein
MKLSDRVEKGAAMSRFLEDDAYVAVDDEGYVCACFFGAAALADIGDADGLTEPGADALCEVAARDFAQYNTRSDSVEKAQAIVDDLNPEQFSLLKLGNVLIWLNDHPKNWMKDDGDPRLALAEAVRKVGL